VSVVNSYLARAVLDDGRHAKEADQPIGVVGTLMSS
jgi:hypothetical protein